MADRYEGQRLNSPNDLVYRSDGTLLFTDPPFGLPGVFDDPGKELAFSGVFAVRDGEVIAASPTSSPAPTAWPSRPTSATSTSATGISTRKVVMRYALDEQCAAREATVFADLTAEPGEDALDGLKVDEAGNVYACGPGGVWIIAPTGERLGLLRLPEDPHNLAWGDADRRTLYITALTGVYRIRLDMPGIAESQGATHEQEPRARPDPARLRAARRERRPAPPVGPAGRQLPRPHARPRRALPARAPAAAGDGRVPRVVPGRVHRDRHRAAQRPARHFKMRIAAGAHWTFLADTDLEVQTDARHQRVHRRSPRPRRRAAHGDARRPA